MQMVRLKDICIGRGEYGIAAAAEEFAEHKYRYLRITDISDYGELLSNDCKSVSCDNCEKYLLNDDEIVFARTGNSTGRAFFYERKYGPLVYAGFLIKFHIDSSKVNPKYLKYYTISKTYKDWIANGPTGSTRGNMSEGDFADMPVFLPSRQEQDFLVALMEPLDMMIINNSAICLDLESMAKLLYDYWFVQFDFPDENGRPYKSSGGKMVWNEELKREIPEGWAATKLEEHIGLERGISYSTSDLQGEGIPMINLGSFAIGGGYKEENLKTYSGAYSDDKIITPYDLIICLTQQTSIDPNKDVIGCSMLVPDIFDVDIVISQDLTKVVCSEELKYYLAQYFNTSYFHRYITGFASGSNILHLDVNGILNNTAVIPPKNVLIKFEKIMKTMFEKRSECLIENQQLASLRDFLLPMLMNGQVKVGKAGD